MLSSRIQTEAASPGEPVSHRHDSIDGPAGSSVELGDQEQPPARCGGDVTGKLANLRLELVERLGARGEIAVRKLDDPGRFRGRESVGSRSSHSTTLAGGSDKKVLQRKGKRRESRG